MLMHLATPSFDNPTLCGITKSRPNNAFMASPCLEEVTCKECLNLLAQLSKGESPDDPL
jgi:hypothetical protein